MSQTKAIARAITILSERGYKVYPSGVNYTTIIKTANGDLILKPEHASEDACGKSLKRWQKRYKTLRRQSELLDDHIRSADRELAKVRQRKNSAWFAVQSLVATQTAKENAKRVKIREAAAAKEKT